MADCTTRQFTMTIGVDLGDRYSYFAVLDEAGELVEEGPSAVPGAPLSRPPYLNSHPPPGGERAGTIS